MPTYPFRSYEMSERRKFQQRMADSISNGVTNSTSSPRKSSMVPRFRPGTSTEETLCSKTHSDSSKCSHPPSAIPLDSRNKTTVSSSTFPTRRAIKTTKHMLERHLASGPFCGWHAQGKPHYLAALEWLTYLNCKPNFHIQNARNGGEHANHRGNKTFLVDGYDAQTNIVYKFHGCFWHDCSKGYPNRD